MLTNSLERKMALLSRNSMEKVLSWGRRKFGDKYATLLWKDELYDLNKVDLADELDLFDFEMHCTMVYDVMCYDSAKYADGLFETQRFWTVQFQLQTRQDKTRQGKTRQDKTRRDEVAPVPHLVYRVVTPREF